MRRLLTVGVAALALVAVPACGSSSKDASPSSSSSSSKDSKESEAKDGDAGKDAAADTSTCVADAKPVSTELPAGYPKGFPLPQGAVLFDVEDRGQQGVVSTAVVKAPLKDVLAALNGPAQQAGFKVTTGETEKHDAEANWSGNGYRGRWAIRDSEHCPGEVVVQLLSAQGES